MYFGNYIINMKKFKYKVLKKYDIIVIRSYKE